MALIGGALAGGGFLSNLLIGAIGVGIKLAVAYFFPTKTEGPRADTLRAQTSKYGDHIARCYGNTRVAGAVIWLKNDQVDEHVSTEREGKALGPEVTTYTYTADFAVAFAWNGPFAAIPRIWADDKLVFDASAESLETAITTSGPGIGVAEGLTVQIYLGTETQPSDPNIEAAVGEGLAPAWPGIAYVVFTNFPLDEFGIRVPNMEAELVRAGDEATFSVDPEAPGAGAWQLDTNGNYFAAVSVAGALQILQLPNFTPIIDEPLDYATAGVHITDRGEVIVVDSNDDRIVVYDAATGIQIQEVSGVPPSTHHGNSLIEDITVDGVTYLMVWQQGGYLTFLANSGSGYSVSWSEITTYNPVVDVQTISMGPEYAYACRNAPLGGQTDEVVLIQGDASAFTSDTSVAIPGANIVIAAHYFQATDSVLVVDDTGSLFMMSADLTTVLDSNTSTGISLTSNPDPLLSKRMEASSDTFIVKDDVSNDVYEFTTSTLVQTDFTEATTTDWIDKNTSGYDYAGINQSYRVILTTSSTGVTPPRLWYLPVIQRISQPLAEVLDAECRLVGLVPDVTQIVTDIFGYPVRDGSAPRGVIEDLLRINNVDFAQVDGTITFFPRKTVSVRTLTTVETGLVLNGDPDPIQVREEYPASYDLPEQVIITYQAYEADYRTGAQAANPDEDQPYGDEPSMADETSAPLTIRRKRPLEFSTNQILTDDNAIKAADILFRDLQDAATVFKSPLGPRQLDLYPGEVIVLPLSDTRSETVVVTKMSGETVLDFEFRKRGDGFTSDAVAQPTPYVRRSLLGIANGTTALIDGHLLRSDDDDDSFYMGVGITSTGQFRSAIVYRSEDGGSTYSPFVAMSNALVRGLARQALPDRPHPDAVDRATTLVIGVPKGTAPASITEAQLLASETSNAFAVYNSTVGDWEYIRAAHVIDNLNGSWSLSILLRGGKGTEFAMAGHAIGDVVYHLDTGAMVRSPEADRTLARKFVAVPQGKQFNAINAVTFTNQGKGLRPWSPTDLDIQRDGSGNITGRFSRRDRLGQAWPESGVETPPMSEDSESYEVRVYYSGSPYNLVRTISVSSEAFTYSAADQTTDFGSVQDEIDWGVVQISAIFGDGIELRQAA